MSDLKSQSVDDRGSSIIVSFKAKWEKDFLAGRVSVFFRKRGPKDMSPMYVYVYVGSPSRKLLGRVRVDEYRWVPIPKALALSRKGCISEHDLAAYAEGYDSLAVYKFSELQKAKRFPDLSELKDRFDFYPPQSFLIVSKSGEVALNEMLGYVDSEL